MARHGFLYQGQWYVWQDNRRGTSSIGLPGRHFVTFLENHDQVANTGLGTRVHHHADPATLRTLTALLLLGPNLPMLFQGQEFGTACRFNYFADHRGELATSVREGRSEFLSQFPGLATCEMQERLPSPSDPATFEASKLERRGDPRHAPVLQLHRDLLSTGRADPVLAELGTGESASRRRHSTDDVLTVRYQRQDGLPRLLVVNFGTDLVLPLMNDPLLAAPPGQGWCAVWSSDDPDYGGTGSCHSRSTPGASPAGPPRSARSGHASACRAGRPCARTCRRQNRRKSPDSALVKRWSRPVHRTSAACKTSPRSSLSISRTSWTGRPGPPSSSTCRSARFAAVSRELSGDDRVGRAAFREPFTALPAVIPESLVRAILRGTVSPRRIGSGPIMSVASPYAEWLESDALGGFASGTVCGERTRRYHALLLVATTPPTGRMVLVNGADVFLTTLEGRFALSSQRYTPDVVYLDGAAGIDAFLSEPWPAWTFTLPDGTRIQHEILIAHRRPLTLLTWRLLSRGSGVSLAVRPLMSGRDYHSLHHENGAFCFDANRDGHIVSWCPYDGVPAVNASRTGTTARSATGIAISSTGPNRIAGSMRSKIRQPSERSVSISPRARHSSR